jgi:hypothetical protein
MALPSVMSCIMRKTPKGGHSEKCNAHKRWALQSLKCSPLRRGKTVCREVPSNDTNEFREGHIKVNPPMDWTLSSCHQLKENDSEPY